MPHYTVWRERVKIVRWNFCKRGGIKRLIPTWDRPISYSSSPPLTRGGGGDESDFLVEIFSPSYVLGRAWNFFGASRVCGRRQNPVAIVWNSAHVLDYHDYSRYFSKVGNKWFVIVRGIQCPQSIIISTVNKLLPLTGKNLMEKSDP